VPASFYEPDGERFLSTELTRGPWDPAFQHAGPPAALLGREVERLEDADEFQVARISFEIMRAVPIVPLRVEMRVTRPGRRVQLVEGSLSDEDGEVMRATAWRLRTAPVELPELPNGEAPPGPESAEQGEFISTGEKVGYHTAMEYRFLEGAFTELGPAKVWMRTPLLIQTSHTHLFGQTLIAGLLGLIFLFSSAGERTKSLIVALPFVGTLLDIGGMWATRFVSPSLSGMVIAGGTLFAAGYALIAALSLYDLWFRKELAT